MRVEGGERRKKQMRGEEHERRTPRTGELQHLRGEVLQDRGRVHRGLGADPHVVLRALLQITVDTAHGELA
jgi:hypothetical protein